MARILIIETATRVCSVALAQNGRTVAIRESDEKNIHASRTMVFVNEVLEEAGLTAKELDAVAVSEGPGSYTGLRIGVSTAKGICYAMDKPLMSISTLRAMAYGAVQLLSKEANPENAFFRPMIDARRMEVYTALYDHMNNPLTEVEARIIEEKSFGEELKQQVTWFFGDGAEKCKELLGSNPHARFLEELRPSAGWMSMLAENKWEQKEFEDLAYFEPFYLKDFIAGIPKVKGLR